MNSRKWIQAMAVVALFGELASAQVIIGANTGTQAGPLTCAVNVSVPNTLRSEGMTELLGDIVQATPFDKEGPQRFVLAVIGRNRFKKETAAARVIHAPALRKVDRFSPR